MSPARGHSLGVGLLMLALFLCSSCVYSKQVINAKVRDLDTSQIVVGQTTVPEILRAWGPPPPLEVFDLVRPADPSLFRLSKSFMRYVSRTQKCVVFNLGVPPPLLASPVLPFRWCDEQPAYAVVVEFDDEGVVERVTQGDIETLWRPWQGEDGRDLQVEMATTPGGSLR
ncbi:MAG: hypothetical protein ABFS46_17160 [Myxococcota bacterium]